MGDQDVAKSSSSRDRMPYTDQQIRREELAIRRTELKAYTTVTILVALVALFSAALGGFATALIQGTTTREVEQKRFEAQLVLKAIETGDTTKAATNLVFLMKAGFIQDPDGKIAALVRNPQTIPVLPFRRNDGDEGDGGGGAGAGMRSQPRQSGSEKAARDPHAEKQTTADSPATPPVTPSPPPPAPPSPSPAP